MSKMLYCWRCHAAGHDSADCGRRSRPGAWCPRCLDSSHWEDGCCSLRTPCSLCSLAGHDSAVHATTDFRKRRLVVEALGWLAFRHWFREPDFWRWWNQSGCTGVPLYAIVASNAG